MLNTSIVINVFTRITARNRTSELFRHPPIPAGSRMIQFGWSRLSRKPVVALVAIVAGFLLSPRIAEAGCGDYITIGNGHVPMAQSMPDQSAADRSSPVRADHNSGNHSLPLRTCHGPNCSNGSVPPLAPTSVTTDSVDRWILTPNDAPPKTVSSPNLLAEPPHVVADGFHLSILRPPRSHTSFSRE